MKKFKETAVAVTSLVICSAISIGAISAFGMAAYCSNGLAAMADDSTEAEVTTTDSSNSDYLRGDVNADNKFDVSDVVLLQRWLLSVPDAHLANWKAADFCEDGRLNVFDLCLMKRELIQQSQDKQITYSVTEKKLLRENMSQHEETEVQIAFSLDELRNIVETAENVEYENSAPDGIDESLFNDKALLVVYTGSTASNTYTIIGNIERKQDNLTVSTITRTPTVAFPDMAYRRFILAVNKADVQGITSVDTIDTSTPFDIAEKDSVYQWYMEWIGS